MKPELEPDYYLNNIRTLLDFVKDRYDFLLSAKESAFYDTFYKLSDDSQRLYTRCLMRKGEVFRLDKFNYKEIADITAAKQELINADLMFEPELDLTSDHIKLFTKAELFEIFPLGCAKSLPRPQIESAVSRSLTDIDDLSALLDDYGIEIVSISMEIFDTYRLLFFGNLRQDLTEFVLQDLGLFTYENYTISDQNLPVQSQAEIVTLKNLYQLSDRLYELEEISEESLDELVLNLPNDKEASSLIERRYERLVNRIARDYERLKLYDKAAKLYETSNRPPANERYIRCLDYLGKYDEAWIALNKLKEESQVSSEQQFANMFGKKLAKKFNKHFDAHILQSKPEETIVAKKTYPYVELNVIDYLVTQNKLGFWVENHLFNTLFSAIYWDALFADVEGAFYNPFQMGPTDINSEDFIERRSSIIKNIEQTFSDEQAFFSHLDKSVASHFGKTSWFSRWSCLGWTAGSTDTSEDMDTPEDLNISGDKDKSLREIGSESYQQEKIEKVFASNSVYNLTKRLMPAEHLQLIVKQILRDPKEKRAGMPDLICFSEEGYELVEVKGPGDRLQNNQKVWLDFYHRHNIPYRILRVKYDD